MSENYSFKKNWILSCVECVVSNKQKSEEWLFSCGFMDHAEHAAYAEHKGHMYRTDIYTVYRTFGNVQNIQKVWIINTEHRLIVSIIYNSLYKEYREQQWKSYYI